LAVRREVSFFEADNSTEAIASQRASAVQVVHHPLADSQLFGDFGGSQHGKAPEGRV
jgi:hypothetical protein